MMEGSRGVKNRGVQTTSQSPTVAASEHMEAITVAEDRPFSAFLRSRSAFAPARSVKHATAHSQIRGIRTNVYPKVASPKGSAKIRMTGREYRLSQKAVTGARKTWAHPNHPGMRGAWVYLALATGSCFICES
jgi:hypothetical protein